MMPIQLTYLSTNVSRKLIFCPSNILNPLVINTSGTKKMSPILERMKTTSVLCRLNYQTRLLIRTPLTIFLFTLCITNEATANSLDDEWNSFQQAQTNSFEDFRSEHDKSFTQFLEQHWDEFDLFQGKTRDVQAKPPKAPIVKNWISSIDENESHASFTTQSKNGSDVMGDSDLFFGHQVNLIDFYSPDFPSLQRPSNKKLALIWERLSGLDHDQTFQQLHATKEHLMMGDWGFYLYLDFLLMKQFQDSNERVSYLWFLLNKMNYNVKIAYDRSQLYLMIPSLQTIYGKSFVQIEETTYYLLGAKSDNSPLLSYPGKYNQDSVNVNVNFKKVIKPSGQKKSRKLTYKEGNKSTQITLDFDTGIGAMLNYYLQTDLIHYFQAQPDETTIKSLRNQLQNKLKGLSERQSINYLLNLTQTGFTYAKDQKQFGEENYLLTEESLLYKANDCEDRSIFLAWLIRDLLNLRVIGLDFPGHIAIAVETQSKQGDWSITIDDHAYVVADPTYIGSQVGMIMPSVKNKIPKVIHF